MGSAMGGLLVLSTEALILGFLKKFIIERRVFLIFAAISAIVALFAVTNIKGVKKNVFNDARKSSTLSWVAFALVLLVALVFARHPKNDVTQTLVQLNGKTSGYLSLSLALLFVVIFTSRAATSV